jgi:hypothetical protein
MSASFLSGIDWSRPWLAPLLPTALPILQAENWRDACDAAAAPLRNHRGLPIRFVPQADLPAKTPYEAYISDTGCVPTRDNLHDFFNALIWLTFPKIKVQLNALQAAEIFRSTSSAVVQVPIPVVGRGGVRDAATIFDENAALVVTRDMRTAEALREHDWRTLFVTNRQSFFRDCEVWLFGHALMEKLVLPYKAITAHAVIVEADNSFFTKGLIEKREWIDDQISLHLANGISTAAFTPLPVLGLPDWWHQQGESFYEDTKVFRSKRLQKK